MEKDPKVVWFEDVGKDDIAKVGGFERFPFRIP